MSAPGIKGSNDFPPIQPAGKVGGGPSGQEGDLSKISTGGIKTLDDLKDTLTSSLGDEKGTELYNKFIQAIAEEMLTQMQQASSRSAKAVKEMGEQR